MSLFNYGSFTLHSGDKSDFKIDCDYLDGDDIAAIAVQIYEKCKPFREVIGVPSGGLRLAAALHPYRYPCPEYPVLVVDDVLTTGTSMEEAKSQIKGGAIGCVIFARRSCPEWVTSIFQMNDISPRRKEV